MPNNEFFKNGRKSQHGVLLANFLCLAAYPYAVWLTDGYDVLLPV
jgi:hypothetical protein